MIKFTCTKDLCRILHGKEKNANTRRTLCSHHYIEREKLGKYISGILSIDNDEADLGKKTNQFINDISDFNNKHIIQCNNKPISNIPEEPRHISSMTPIGFSNGQDESICYVNLSFRVIFFNTFFRTVIMNIYCENILANMDNSTDDYRGNLQKIMILQVIQQIFCEMLIGGRKIVNSVLIWYRTKSYGRLTGYIN